MNLIELERAAYMGGDRDTAALCVRAIEGDEDHREGLEQVRSDLEAVESRVAATQAILADWDEEMLEPIRKYVEHCDDNAELLAIIRQVQSDLYDRVMQLETTLC